MNKKDDVVTENQSLTFAQSNSLNQANSLLISRGLLSKNDFPSLVIERLENLLRCSNLFLRPDKHVKVLHLNFKYVRLAVESLAADKHTECSWHSCACSLGFLRLAMSYPELLEFGDQSWCIVGFDVCLKFFIIVLTITTSSRSASASDFLSFKKIVEILHKVWSRSWMAYKYDLALGINNSDVRNSVDSKLFVSNTLSISHVVVLN